MLKKNLLFSFILIFFSCHIHSQQNRIAGIMISTGIANDINNLGLNFRPALGYKAGLFLDHSLNQRLSVVSEFGYVKTGFNDQMYYTLPGTPTRTADFTINYHKIFASGGIKIPLMKNRLIYFKPGVAFHYLLNYDVRKQLGTDVYYFTHTIERYRKLQLYGDFEIGIDVNNFSAAVRISPQIINNVKQKENLKAFSYFTGISLRFPLKYFK